jgi:hypothetical protein
MTKPTAKTAYEYEPFETIFLARREEIMRLVNVASYALRAMEGAARLNEVLKKSSEQVNQVREIEKIALEEVDADFPLIHSAATVLLWGALEAAVRDFLVRWLVKYPDARKAPDLARIRVQVGDYEVLEGESRMRYLLNLLEREIGATLKPGAGRFDSLLKPFNIDPRLDDKLRRDLNEMAAVRNVIVHRAGIVDQRLLQLCPWLSYKLNDPIRVHRSDVIRYLESASNYAAALIESAQQICHDSGNNVGAT